MHEYEKIGLWQLVVALIGSICVAIGWYSAHLFPGQIPQTLAELVEAIVSIAVIGFNILHLVVLSAVARRSDSSQSIMNPSHNNPFCGLVQVYLNVPGGILVAVVAMLCVTAVVVQSVMPAEQPLDSPSRSAPASTEIAELTQTDDAEQQSVPDRADSAVYQADGFGIAVDDAKTPEHRRQTALQAARLDAAANLLEQIVGSVYERIRTAENGQIEKDTIVQTLRGWLPMRTQTIDETYTDATGVALIRVELVLTEEMLQEIRQHVAAAQ
ncbi:MAG: hypothetical protein IAE92_05660 [Burkholderiaceae bacterium]|nr:hypothetical protein [Burkholderiaceae bacterium]